MRQGGALQRSSLLLVRGCSALPLSLSCLQAPTHATDDARKLLAEDYLSRCLGQSVAKLKPGLYCISDAGDDEAQRRLEPLQQHHPQPAQVTCTASRAGPGASGASADLRSTRHHDEPATDSPQAA